jgi:hypothetical protein
MLHAYVNTMRMQNEQALRDKRVEKGGREQWRGCVGTDWSRVQVPIAKYVQDFDVSIHIGFPEAADAQRVECGHQVRNMYHSKATGVRNPAACSVCFNNGAVPRLLELNTFSVRQDRQTWVYVRAPTLCDTSLLCNLRKVRANCSCITRNPQSLHLDEELR